MSSPVDSFWQDQYKPPTLPGAIVLVLLVLFALLTFGRGFDYAVDPYSRGGIAPSQVVMDALVGLKFWGYAYMLGSAALLLGLVFRNHVSVWLSHIFLTALNFAVSIMVFQSASYYDEGFSEAVLPIAMTLWHVTFVYLSRPNFSAVGRE